MTARIAKRNLGNASLAHDVCYERGVFILPFAWGVPGKYHGNRCWGNYLWHLVGGTEKNHGIVSGKLITRPRFETNISRIRVDDVSG
jgi:hypothetical protein